MSGLTAGKAWSIKLSPVQCLVLQAMADHADLEGRNVWPSVGLVVWKTGLSERSVHNAIKELIGMNVLVPRVEQERGPGKYMIYDVVVENGPQKPPFIRNKKGASPAPLIKKGASDDIMGASGALMGASDDTSHIVDRARVLTVLEPSLEPSNTLFDSDESVTQPSKEPVKDPPKPNPVAIYCDAFRGRYGQDPVISRKDAGIISQLYKSLSPKNYSAALAGYFATNDPFILTNVHEPGMLASKVNRWIMEGKSADIVNVQAEDSENESHTGGFDYVSPNHKYDYSGANTDHAE